MPRHAVPALRLRHRNRRNRTPVSVEPRRRVAVGHIGNRHRAGAGKRYGQDVRGQAVGNASTLHTALESEPFCGALQGVEKRKTLLCSRPGCGTRQIFPQRICIPMGRQRKRQRHCDAPAAHTRFFQKQGKAAAKKNAPCALYSATWPNTNGISPTFCSALP